MAATKSDQAYATLRRAIVMGRLPEDEPLDEGLLMAEFGFGRTPVREALKRLANDRFINWPPHRTPYVRGIRAAELPRLYEARHLLEVPCTELAVARADDEELAGLEAMCEQMAEEVAKNRAYEAVELDHAFHLGVAKATGNRWLADSVERLNCGSLRIWYVAHARLGMNFVVDQHVQILRAIQRRDASEAARLATAHIDTSYRRQLESRELPVRSRALTTPGETS